MRAAPALLTSVLATALYASAAWFAGLGEGGWLAARVTGLGSALFLGLAVHDALRPRPSHAMALLCLAAGLLASVGLFFGTLFAGDAGHSTRHISAFQPWALVGLFLGLGALLVLPLLRVWGHAVREDGDAGLSIERDAPGEERDVCAVAKPRRDDGA